MICRIWPRETVSEALSVPSPDATLSSISRMSKSPSSELPSKSEKLCTTALRTFWFRRQKVRNAVVHNFSDFEGSSEDGDFDILEMLDNVASGLGTESASETVSRGQILQIIDQ